MSNVNKFLAVSALYLGLSSAVPAEETANPPSEPAMTQAPAGPEVGRGRAEAPSNTANTPDPGHAGITISM